MPGARRLPAAAATGTAPVNVAPQRLFGLAFAMPGEFSRDEVRRIAALANLELAPSEIELFARQLGDILSYAKALQQIDTTGVEPTAAMVGRHTADRADELRPSLDRTAALAGAPDAAPSAGLYKVPRVIG